MKEEIVEVTFLQRDDMVLVKAEGTFPVGSSKDFSVFIWLISINMESSIN